MKKELEHFRIGKFYGGSQDWFMDPWMRLGGCASLAAVDSSIFLAMHKKVKKICPIDWHKLSKDSYKRFGYEMKPYLRPRAGGVNKLSIFTESFGKFMADNEVKGVSIKEFPMGCSYEAAENMLKEQIDKGFLVPILHLVSKVKAVKDYYWHWFLLNGYEETEEGLLVKAVTYGDYRWLHFRDLWNEDDKDNGGLIIYDLI